MNDTKKLRELNQQSKELNAERKAIREELEATKEHRANLRKVKALCRVNYPKYKKELSAKLREVIDVFSQGDPDEIVKLKNEIDVLSTFIDDTMSVFSEACDGELMEWYLVEYGE